MQKINPKLHSPKNKRELNSADIWPCDLVVNGQDKFVMTSEAVCVEFRGYVGCYSHRPIIREKSK